MTIALHVLGALELRAPDGRALLSLHAQPKRLGLLAYLALAPASLPPRRDALVALFWPQLDEHHARAALRQAAYHLRQVLGESALVRRGHDTLALDPAQVECDAVKFVEELDAGCVEAAMARYRGDLLDAFHLRGTPAFDEWLERERARLRTRAAAGAWSVAELRAAAGEVEEAASWGKRALLLSNDDETMLQRLLRMLEGLGDRVRAVTEYEAFTRRVRRDYEIEPSMETRRIITAIRLHITAQSHPIARLDAGAGVRGSPVGDQPMRGSAPEPVRPTPAPTTVLLTLVRSSWRDGGWRSFASRAAVVVLAPAIVLLVVAWWIAG